MQPKNKVGRPPIVSGKRRTKLKNILKRNKRSGSRKLTGKIEEQLGVNIADRTIRKYAHEFGFNWGKPQKVPLLRDEHKLLRLKFAKKYLRGDVSPIIFTDEASFTIQSPVIGQRYEKGHRPDVGKLPHWKMIHVWWDISLRYNITPYLFTENLNAELYQEILSQRLPSANKNDWILQ